jgi:hypothetical protein
MSRWLSIVALLVAAGCLDFLWRRVRAESGRYRVSLASRLQADPRSASDAQGSDETPQDNNHSSHVQRVSDGSQGAFRPRF